MPRDNKAWKSNVLISEVYLAMIVNPVFSLVLPKREQKNPNKPEKLDRDDKRQTAKSVKMRSKTHSKYHIM